MSLQLLWPDYLVERDENRCIQCEVCAKQCANEVHRLDNDTGKMVADEMKCVDCHRCVAMCPTRALKIRVNEALMGKEVATGPLDDEDKAFLKQTIDEYGKYFDVSAKGVKVEDFKKYQPKSSRPYGNMYVEN